MICILQYLNDALYTYLTVLVWSAIKYCELQKPISPGSEAGKDTINTVRFSKSHGLRPHKWQLLLGLMS